MTVNRLPPEVLARIFSWTTDNEWSWEPYVGFCSCCLVCRSWLDIAQRLLYSEIMIRDSQCLILAHRTLMSSNKLAEYVREMEISLPPSPGLSHAEAEQMVAECLERTSQLAILTFRNGSPQHFTKLVAARVHRLSKLKEFTLDRTFCPSRMDNHEEEHESDGFVPDGWLPLPKSIEKLEFSLPPVSPEVLAQLFGNLDLLGLARGFQESGQSDEAGNLLTQPKGLRSLTLTLESGEVQHGPLLQKFYANLSFLLNSTLTSFTLRNSRALEKEDLTRLLSAMPLLEHLKLHFVDVSGDLFGGLKPFTKLQTFACILWDDQESQNDFVHSCDRFCQSFIHFIRYSPHFHSFSLDARCCSLRLRDVLSSLVHGLVIATSLDRPPHHSRLRKLDISLMGDLPIEALEELCQAAPNLQELRVSINGDNCRILNALKSLTEPHLIAVNGWSLLMTGEPKGINLDMLDLPDGLPPYDLCPSESEAD